VDDADQNALLDHLDKRETAKAQDLLRALRVSAACHETIDGLFGLRGVDWTTILAKGRSLLRERAGALAALDALENILGLARSFGVKTPFFLDLGFARGLEYYTGMIFEVYVPELGIALGGGGRYDGLVELFGGEPLPAVGCAPGIDRLVLALGQKGLFPETLTHVTKTLVISVSEALLSTALELAADLREHGVVAHNEVTGRNVGAALSYAAKKQYRYVVIVGPKELERGGVILRDLKAKAQREVLVARLSDELGGP